MAILGGEIVRFGRRAGAGDQSTDEGGLSWTGRPVPAWEKLGQHPLRRELTRGGPVFSEYKKGGRTQEEAGGDT